MSQRCELFHADNPRFHEQFQPVSALTRCLPNSSPATSRVSIYVAVTQHAPFFHLEQRIAAFSDELIRALPVRSPSGFRRCRSSLVAPFSSAPRAGEWKWCRIQRACCPNRRQRFMRGSRSFVIPSEVEESLILRITSGKRCLGCARHDKNSVWATPVYR